MSLRGMITGGTGMVVHTDALAVIANNLANANTNAFKRAQMRFADIFYQILKLAGQGTVSPSGVGIALGTGVETATTTTFFSPGAMQIGQPLDVFIQGQGQGGVDFFRVTDPSGNLFYTRLGAFQPKTSGASGPVNLQLGNTVYTVDPPIQLPGQPGTILVTLDGVVSQGGVQAGQFQLARFRNPDGLLKVGDLLFAATDASGAEVVGTPNSNQFGATVQSALEESNVDIATELVAMLQTSRAFNLSAQSFRAGNDELETTIALARAG